MCDSGNVTSLLSNNNKESAVQAAFTEFYTEVKQIEVRDSVLTSTQQIDRLNRPGSSYFNLNPYDVLQVDPETPLAEIRKKYRMMSLLVHPDKNPDDIERAQKAFEACSRAFKTLENEVGYKKCQEVVEEAKHIVDEMIEKKRRKSRGREEIEEDNPEKYKHAIYVQVCKLFADLERLRVMEEAREANERKKKVIEEDIAKEKKALESVFNQNYEESRTDRVQSWREFKTSSKSKRSRKMGGFNIFKPPKTKMERRPD